MRRIYLLASNLRILASTAAIILTAVLSLFSQSAQAQSGFSLSLDGQSWVKVTNNSTVDMTGSFTVEAWVKTTFTARQGIVERYNNAATTGSDGGYALRILKTGQVAFFTLQNSTVFDEVISANSISLNTWHHVAGVYNAGTGILSIFVDGFLQGTTSGRAPASGTSNLFIGTSADSAGFFTGLIDEVRLTNGALYSGNFTPPGHANPLSGTVGLWSFDDKTLNDSSGLGNNGVAKGTGTLAFSTDIPAVGRPTVSITSPSDGTIITARQATVTVSATASAPSGTIAQVQFFANGNSIGASTSAPYTATATLAEGSYTLTAVATDNTGLSATSSPVSLTIQDIPPTVSITAPANGVSFTPPATINISATASDLDGTVAQVQFFANGNLIGTSAGAPYSIVWSNVAAGSYGLTAVATDNLGKSTTSGTVNITVGIRPPLLVSLTAPAQGDAFTAPAAITITATASEVGGTVSQVQFFANSTLIGARSTSPYTITWSNVSAGAYSLTAVAIDGTGASSTSSAVNITVNAQPPLYEGFLDGASCTTINGWAWDSHNPGTRVNVDILDGATLLGTTPANLFRQDLLNAGKGDGFHAFSFSTPSSLLDGATHNITARFNGTTIGLSTTPPGPKSLNCQPPSFPISGFISPKFLVLSVLYAPPGSKSKVDYTNSTMLGTSTSISSSFSNMTSESISFTEGFSIFGIGLTTTETASTAFTQEQDTSSSIAVNETTTDQTTILGPQIPPVGLDHEADLIRVWLNPVFKIKMTDANTIVWKAFAFDDRDGNTMDVLDIPVKFLRRPDTITDPDLIRRLQRTWADDPTDGSGRGLTRADLDAILKADPFTSSYSIDILPGSNCTADGRFCLTSNPLLQYVPAAQGNQPSPHGFSLMHQTTETQGQGGSTTQQSGFSVEVKQGVDEKIKNKLMLSFSETLKVSNTLTLTNKFNTESTTQVGQTIAASITPPAFEDGYTGPVEFNVFQDNIYGSFMFAAVPAPNFTVSATPTLEKVPAASCATYMVSVSPLPGTNFNSTVSLTASVAPPADIAASFDKVTIDGGSGTRTLSVCTTSTTPLGAYTITISGTAGLETHSFAVTLKVK
jgi:hypothetical protein